MDDRQLDDLLDRAARSWRTPPEAPVDRIWDGVVAEAFAPAPRRRHGWLPMTAAVAASLLIGVMVGRRSVPPATVAMGDPVGVVAPATPTVQVDDPYHRTTEALLGETALLLAALPESDARTATPETVAAQGAELLRTTRLLLDSPVGSDPRMRTLLEDLELVLAQVARLRVRQPDELTLIHDALDQREIVPRIRSAVADLSYSTN